MSARRYGCMLCLLIICAFQLAVQGQKNAKVAGMPQVMRYSGTASEGGGPRTGTVGLVLALYSSRTGGVALWQETQNVVLDEQGRYNVLLGSSRELPKDLFATNEARWLGVQVLADGEAEQGRVMLVSVPYALKAQDAETLGGRPASEYLLAGAGSPFVVPKAKSGSGQAAALETDANVQSTAGGTPNAIPKFSTAFEVVDSMLLEQYNQAAVNAFGTTIANEDVVRVGDGTGLGKRVEIAGRMVATGFDIVTSAVDSVHIVNNHPNGSGMQANARNTTGNAIGILGTTESPNGAGVVGIAVPATTVPGDQSFGVIGYTWNPGAAILGLSIADDAGGFGGLPTFTEKTGIYAGVNSSTSTPLIIDNRHASGTKLLSARLQGVEKIAMTTAGNITASGAVTAASFSGSGAALTGVNASSATALASDPAACAANSFVRDMAANGTLTCTQPSSSNLSDGANLATITYADAGDAALAAPQYVTLATSGTLANERVLTAGKGIAITDGGATVTIDNKAEFAQTSIAGGDTLTAAGSFATGFTFPANTLSTGTVIEVWAAGSSTWTGGSTGVLTFGVKLGSTIVLPEISLGQNSAAQTNRMWRLQARLVCTSSGASGTLESQGDLIGWPFSGAYSVMPSVSLAPITIDTTTTQTFAIFEGVTNATGQSVTMRQLIVKILK